MSCLNCKKPFQVDTILICDKECGTIYCGSCVKPHFKGALEHDKKCTGTGKKFPDPTEKCPKCGKLAKVDTMKYEFGTGKKYCQPCYAIIPKLNPASTVPKPQFVDLSKPVPGFLDIPDDQSKDSKILSETYERAEVTVPGLSTGSGPKPSAKPSALPTTTVPSPAQGLRTPFGIGK